MSTTTLTVVPGFAAASVTLTALSRLDTSAPVAITGGGAFADGGSGSWTYSVTDPATPAPLYAYTYTIVYATGQRLTRTKSTGALPPVNTRLGTRNVTLSQHDQAPIVFPLADAAGNPLSLAGKTVQLSVWHSPDGGVTQLVDATHDNALLGGLAVGGADNNVVTWTPSPSDVAALAAGRRFNLWNATDKVGLLAGTINMLPAVLT